MKKDNKENIGMCKKMSNVKQNNIFCANCKQLLKADQAFLNKFCSKECYDFYTGIIPVPDYMISDSAKINNCLYFKNGHCKNDENPDYYNQKCPGDCDYYYRK